jgi:hypothetical protein
MTRKRVIAVLILVLSPNLSATIAQRTDSQMLRTQSAKLILVGEVLYLAKPNRALTNPGIDRQVVVFRVREVLKGTYSAQKVRISIGFYFDDRSPLVEQKSGNAFRLSPGILKKRTKWIIFLADEPQESLKKAGRRFIDFCEEPKPTAEFKRYMLAPCYFVSTDAAIAATKERIESLRSLVSKK